MSDWLAAYEAQKAKALKKIEEQGKTSGSSGDRGALAGSTSFQGLVDAKEVRHLSRSTQITKIMDSMKTKTPPPPPKPQTQLPRAVPPPKPTAPRPPLPQPNTTTSFTQLAKSPQPALNEAPTSTNLKSATVSEPASCNGGEVLSNRQAKKRAQHSEPSVHQLMRKVKKDASRSADDWKTLYEERKKQAMENMSKAKDGDVNVAAISAFHTSGTSQDMLTSKSPQATYQNATTPTQSLKRPSQSQSSSGLPTYPKPQTRPYASSAAPSNSSLRSGMPNGRGPQPLMNVNVAGPTMSGPSRSGGGRPPPPHLLISHELNQPTKKS